MYKKNKKLYTHTRAAGCVRFGGRAGVCVYNFIFLYIFVFFCTCLYIL